MGKSAIFNSFLYVYQRVRTIFQAQGNVTTKYGLKNGTNMY